MRRTRKQRKFSRKRGGGGNKNHGRLNCEEEGFNVDMRYATFGSEYNKSVGAIHEDGEKWDYETLVDFTMNGRIIDWYIRQLQMKGVVMTPEDIHRIKTNPDLQILGAFFHRYKVVAERASTIRYNLSKGVNEFFPMGFSNYKTKNSFTRLLADIKNEKLEKPLNPYVFNLLSQFIYHIEQGTVMNDLPIETAIDRAQCLMFYIVKHKGKIPPGFEMDPRIVARARTPILINGYVHGWGGAKTTPTLEWLNFIQRESKELNDPLVSFGVFE